MVKKYKKNLESIVLKYAPGSPRLVNNEETSQSNTAPAAVPVNRKFLLAPSLNRKMKVRLCSSFDPIMV